MKDLKEPCDSTHWTTP